MTEPPENPDSETRGWRAAFGPPWVAGVAAALLLAAVIAAATAILRRETDPGDLVRITSSIEWQAGNHWIVPPEASGGEDPPPAPDCTDDQRQARIRWFVDHEGVPVGSYWVRVEIVNDSAATLTIRSLTLESFKRLPRLRGDAIVLCSEGSGDIGEQYVGLNLTERPPTFRFYDNTYRPTRPFKFAPSPGEPVVLYIVVGAGSSPIDPKPVERYRWSMRLRYAINGKVASKVIDDGGHPFDITDTPQQPVPPG